MPDFKFAEVEDDVDNLNPGQKSIQPDEGMIAYLPTTNANSQDLVKFWNMWQREDSGDMVLYNASGVELERVTPEGNIAYNGATIQATTDLNYVYEYRGITVKMYRKVNPEIVPNVITSSNCYFYGGGGGVWKRIEAGKDATITTIGAGVTIEHMIPSSVADGAWYTTTYETKRTDVNGNIAYNGASIPAVGTTIADLSSTGKYEFYKDGRVVLTGLGGYWIELTNCFPNGSNAYTYIATGVASRTYHLQDGSTIVQTRASGMAGAVITSFSEVYNQDAVTGSINIKAGGTFTATL